MSIHTPEIQYQRHIITIDSADRSVAYPSSSAYTIQLPADFKNIVRARLISAEIPGSFYVFAAALGNTSLKVNTTVVTIPDGNYTVTTLTAAVETAIKTVLASATVTFNATTRKITIANTGAFSIDATIGGLAQLLGFNSAVVNSTGNQISAPRPMTALPYTYILLDIENFNRIDECGGAPGIHGAFAKVPLRNGSGADLFLNEQDCISNPSALRLPQGRTDRLQIRWRFHDGKLVDFNNVNHSFTLELTCVENQLNPLGAVPTPMREK